MVLGVTGGPAEGEREGGGYMAAVVGTVSGVGVGAALGQVLGAPVALWAANSVDVRTDETGMEAVVEIVGLLLLAVMMAVTAFFLTVVLVSWLGAVLGCGVALHLANQPHAKRTALAVGAIGPPTLVLLFNLLGSVRGVAAAAAIGVTAVLSAVAARRLVLAFPR